MPRALGTLYIEEERLPQLSKEFGELSPGEELVLQVRPAPRALLPYLLLTIILASSIIFVPIAMLMGIALIFLYFVSFRSVRYFITTERIILLRKVLSLDRQEIPYTTVHDFEVDQRTGGKILNYGSIIPVLDHAQIETNDSGDSVGALRTLSHISDPHRIHSLLRSLSHSKNNTMTI